MAEVVNVKSAPIPAKTLKKLREEIQERSRLQELGEQRQNTVNKMILTLLEVLGFESENFDDYIIDLAEGVIKLKDVGREVRTDDVELVK